MKKIFFSLYIVLFSLVANAQNLFLPLSLNSHISDYPTSFVEYKNSFYFGVLKGYGIGRTTRDSVTGLCFKTDKNGQLLQRFDLSGLFGRQYVTVEAVGVKNDSVYLTGTYGYFSLNDSNVYFNKVFVLQLDTNLNPYKLDTFAYFGSSAANIRVIKTLFLKDRIIMGYSSSPYNIIDPATSSFITAYDYSVNRIHHQSIDSIFLNNSPYSSYNECLGISTHTNSSFVINNINRTPDPIDPSIAVGYSMTLLVDTAMNVLELIDTIERKPSLPLNRWLYVNYAQNFKHPNGTYFIGPLFGTGAGGRIGLGKLNSTYDTVLTGAYISPYNVADNAPFLAFKNTIELLRNQKEVIVYGISFYNRQYQTLPSYLRLAKYDTSLNIIWERTFGHSNTTFVPIGVHELQDGGLMVLAAVYDFTNVTLSSTNYDFYCFILDSTGAPLSTFTLPNPTQNAVTIYPNPATEEIRFGLPNGSAQAEYLLTDMQGKVLRSGIYQSGEALSVSAFPPALYLYKVRTADGVWHSGLFTKQ